MSRKSTRRVALRADQCAPMLRECCTRVLAISGCVLVVQHKVDARAPPLRPSHCGCTRSARAPCWRVAAPASPRAAERAQGALRSTRRGRPPAARSSRLPAPATVGAWRQVRRPHLQRRRCRCARLCRHHHRRHASRRRRRRRRRRAWRARCRGARVRSASRSGGAAARPPPSSPRPPRPPCRALPRRRPLARRLPPPPARAPGPRRVAAARTRGPMDVGRGAAVAAPHRRPGVSCRRCRGCGGSAGP